MKTIGVFVSVYPPPFVGGAEQSTKDYTEFLESCGFRVLVYSLLERHEKPQEIKVGSNIIIKKYPIKLPWHPLLITSKRSKMCRLIWHVANLYQSKNNYEIKKLLIQDKIDLVLCHNIPGWGTLPWRAASDLEIPLIQMCHDYGLICFKSSLWTRKLTTCTGKCVSCLPRRISTRKHLVAKSLISVSQYVSTTITKSLWNSDVSEKLKLNVIRPPVMPPDTFNFNHQAEYDLGFLGRITQEKGIEELLEAAFRLNCTLLVAGNGEMNYVSMLTQKYPCATFIGTMEKWEFLSKIKVLVAPSLWAEPLARTIMEAAIVGKPTVSSNRGGMPEIFASNNSKIIGVDPQDKEKLDIALIDALKLDQGDRIDTSDKGLELSGWQLVDEINEIFNS
jgi:glycosyltransferase involved in cell wall biosynthesis